MTNDQLRQLERVLEERFFAHIPFRIDGSVKGWTEQQHKGNRFSRSLAAFSISKLVNLTEAEACQAVIDGSDDNDIDALYFDVATKQLVLLQAKFSPGKEPDLADTLKFIEGVKNLFARRFDGFNAAFRLKELELLNAFDEPKLQIVIALAHLGGELSRHTAPKLQDLLSELNQYGDRAVFKNLNGNELYTTLTHEHSLVAIDDVVELHHWVMSKTSPRILYGQISAKQLADLFEKHGKNIFAKNIRNYVGSSDVNDAIVKTVREEPDLLMHLNNGLTMVCREFAPRAAALPAQGFIDIKGLSIVNGAQTVGSIATVARDLDLSTSPAKVFVTLIESASASPDFEMRVTRARNTQNRVRVADFAAQDITQERLRRLVLLGLWHTKWGDVGCWWNFRRRRTPILFLGFVK